MKKSLTISHLASKVKSARILHNCVTAVDLPLDAQVDVLESIGLNPVATGLFKAHTIQLQFKILMEAKPQ